MNINQYFEIKNPKKIVKWGINETTLKELFIDYNLKHITNRYYTIVCSSFAGENHSLGFHFKNNLLSKLEFFRNNQSDLEKSYSDFQKKFESEFGKPTKIKRNDYQNFSYCLWELDNVNIFHYVLERFVLEEYLYIEFIDTKK